jgi:hypothetical protein
MRLHVDVLGLAHRLWGGFGVLAGGSLGLLAAGARVALVEQGGGPDAGRQAVWVLAAAGGLLVAVGGAMLVTGRGLRQRSPGSRHVALGLAVPHLVIVPFGTALAIYTFWVLLNDDARREFGRPARGPRVDA